MAKKIIYNSTFLKESVRIAAWIEDKWSKKEADNFITFLYSRVQRLANTPLAGSPAKKAKNVRKVVITKYNKVYYRVNRNTITILTLFETRLNPKKNRYE